MSLGGSDLNLLEALRVLLEEGNVTRAGRRLEMSQPAMSGALGKLRRHFDDELLVRNGRDFELTPLARELLPEVQEALRLIRAALQVDSVFLPETSERVYRLTMSDYALSVIHAPLLRQLRELAPLVRIEIDPLPADLRESERVLADYDIVIGPLGYGFPGVARAFFSDRMVCLVDRENPALIDGTLSMEALARLPHAVAAFGRGNLTPADRIVGERGIHRRISVVVSGWLPLPYVIVGTDMVAIVPERMARRHCLDGRLVVVDSPFGDVVLAEGYSYAEHRESDPGHRWLCERLDEVAAGLPPC